MLETTESISLLAIMEIVGPIVLLVALIYGTVQWRRRRHSLRSDRAREEATRRLYERGAEQERAGK
jgi:membrane-anchored protein YejM (alkaline phosphatase superfamily)